MPSMIPPKAPEWWRRAQWALAGCLLALGLAACGPGTGGTGTGPVQGVQLFGAGAQPSFSPPGAACAGECAGAQLRLEPEAVELASGCVRFTRSGAWSVDAGGVAVIEGSVETQGRDGRQTQPATLRLQFTGAVESATTVTATLTDARGVVLLGPVPLARQQVASAAGACTP
jgi:hypothetical protein